MRNGRRMVTCLGLVVLGTLAASPSRGEQATAERESPGHGIGARAYFISRAVSMPLTRPPQNVAAWLDLTEGPLIVSTPDTGRHYVLPMRDRWEGVSVSPDAPIVGTRASDFLVALPSWQGPLPAGVARIDSPTRYVWIIDAAETGGIRGYDPARRVQAGYEVTDLREWARHPMRVTPEIGSVLRTMFLSIADEPGRR